MDLEKQVPGTTHNSVVGDCNVAQATWSMDDSELVDSQVARLIRNNIAGSQVKHQTPLTPRKAPLLQGRLPTTIAERGRRVCHWQ